MEAALRTVYELVTGRELPFKGLHVTPIEGNEQIKKAELKLENCLPHYSYLEGFVVKVAVTSGFAGRGHPHEGNRLRQGGIPLRGSHGCPGGCIVGGGQPRATVRAAWNERAKGIYHEDDNKKLRKSHENPAIQKLYSEFLLEPLGHKSHDLLHTHYTPRGRYNELLPQEDKE